jgi:hypothetical protein
VDVKHQVGGVNPAVAVNVSIVAEARKGKR